MTRKEKDKIILGRCGFQKKALFKVLLIYFPFEHIYQNAKDTEFYVSADHVAEKSYEDLKQLSKHVAQFCNYDYFENGKLYFNYARWTKL